MAYKINEATWRYARVALVVGQIRDTVDSRFSFLVVGIRGGPAPMPKWCCCHGQIAKQDHGPNRIAYTVCIAFVRESRNQIMIAGMLG